LNNKNEKEIKYNMIFEHAKGYLKSETVIPHYPEIHSVIVHGIIFSLALVTCRLLRTHRQM